MCGRTETVERRRMVRALAGAAAVLTVRYGGGFLLALAGLGWRCWVRNLMVLALCVLLFQGIWYGLQALGERPRVRGAGRRSSWVWPAARPWWAGALPSPVRLFPAGL